MAVPTQRAIPSVTTHAAPRRALGLGVVCAISLLVGAIWSARSTGATYATLDRRATISTIDAVPLVAHAVLTLSLSWGVVLVLLSMRALRQHIETQEPNSYLTLPDGLVGRIAAVLLAATLITTSAVASAPRAFATTHVHVDARDTAPQPSFSTPGDNAPRADQSCPGPAPTPGWRATAPSRATSTGTASAPLVTGCAGPHDDVSEIVVRRGDSLWAMVARHLRTEDPAVIATQWPRWYAANRTAIGPDPDLIHTGQVLQIPPMDQISPVRQGEVR